MAAVCTDFKRQTGISFSSFFGGLRPAELQEHPLAASRLNWSWSTSNPPCLSCAAKIRYAPSRRCCSRQRQSRRRTDAARSVQDAGLHQLRLHRRAQRHKSTFRNGVAAFKSLVLELDCQHITWHVYLDHTLHGWFYLTHNYQGLSLIKWLYSQRRNCVTTSQEGVTADELLLYWAKRNGHHIISRDSFSDQDTSWLREAAEANYPLLHKFYTDGYNI